LNGTKRYLDAPNITPRGIADLLTIALGLGVSVEVTSSLNGRYQIRLEVDMRDYLEVLGVSPLIGTAALNRQDGPDLSRFISNVQLRVPARAQTALLEAYQKSLKKFGLQVEPHKVTVQTVVVDHLERAPTNN
jgi:uncharacterized protein (TIGR03435 family)